MARTLTELDVDHVVDWLITDRVSDSTDDRILSAASASLRRGGLRALEVEEVAAEAGVGRSTIYRRFDNRNTLLAATIASELRQLLTVLARAVADESGTTDRVARAFAAALEMAESSGLAARARTEPILLRILSVDATFVIESAAGHLTTLAADAGLDVDHDRAMATARVLIRLALSNLLAPDPALLDDTGRVCVDGARRVLAPVLLPG